MIRRVGLIGVAAGALGVAACGAVSGTPIEGGPLGRDGGDPSRADGGPPENDAGHGTSSSSACRGGRWCWANPTVVGEDFVGVWTPDPPEESQRGAWAVSGDGTIVHYDHYHRWSIVDQPTADYETFGIFGTGADDVWVPAWDDGREVAFFRHFDGQMWSTVAAPSQKRIYAVWGTAKSDLWAVGDSVVLRYDGSSWKPFESPASDAEYADIWGTSSNDVYIVPAEGRTAHWDGTAWSHIGERPQHLEAGLGVWGFAPDDVWVAREVYPRNSDGPQLALDHFDGRAWTRTVGGDHQNCWNNSGRGNRISRHLWGRKDKDGEVELFVAGYEASCVWHKRGSILSPEKVQESSSLAITAISGRWAVGQGGTIASWGSSGDSDHVWWSMPRTSSGWVLSVASRGRNDAWAASLFYDSGRTNSNTTALLHYDGVGTAIIEPFKLNDARVFAMTASGSDVWSGGYGYSVESNGSWTPHAFVSHFDGSTWTESLLPSGMVIDALWASGPGDVWAAARTNQGDRIFHFDGKSWNGVSGSGGHQYLSNRIDISGTRPNDVWLVGSGVFHWNGELLENRMAMFGKELPVGVAAIAPDDVWFLRHHSALHWDGKNLVSHELPASARSPIWAEDIRANKNGQVVIAGAREIEGRRGGRSVLFRWDGTNFVPVYVPNISASSTPSRPRIALNEDEIWLGGGASLLVGTSLR